MLYISWGKGKSWRKCSFLYLLGQFYWLGGKYEWSCWSPYFHPLFVHCVYISGGVHHSNNALCCPLRPIDPGCHPAWVHGRYQSLPPYRFQAAQQSWGEKLFVVVRPRCEILNVMHRPFDPSFFSFEFLMKLNYFKSIFAHWTATKYAENLEGWIFFFFCRCSFTVYYCTPHSSIAELMCVL